MPPAVPTLASQPVPQGKLVLKRQKRKSSVSLVVYLISDSHRYSPCWLSQDEPSARLQQMFEAFPEINAADMEASFKEALLTSAHAPNQQLT